MAIGAVGSSAGKTNTKNNINYKMSLADSPTRKRERQRLVHGMTVAELHADGELTTD